MEGVVSWYEVLQQPRVNQPRLEDWGERFQKSCLRGGDALCLVAQWCPLRPHGLQAARLYCSWDSPGKKTGVGCHALLQGIFPAQGSKPGLPHCRQILYPLSSPGKPMNTGVGSLSLLQGIFPIQESSQGLLHCSWILYQLSNQGSPFMVGVKLIDYLMRVALQERHVHSEKMFGEKVTISTYEKT